MVLLVKDVRRPVEARQSWQMDPGVFPYLFPYLNPAAFTLQVGIGVSLPESGRHHVPGKHLVFLYLHPATFTLQVNGEMYHYRRCDHFLSGFFFAQ